MSIFPSVFFFIFYAYDHFPAPICQPSVPQQDRCGRDCFCHLQFAKQPLRVLLNHIYNKRREKRSVLQTFFPPKHINFVFLMNARHNNASRTARGFTAEGTVTGPAEGLIPACLIYLTLRQSSSPDLIPIPPPATYRMRREPRGKRYKNTRATEIYEHHANEE